MQLNYAKAKSICTDAEFKLLGFAKPKELAALKLGELKKFIPQARKYSDKWLAQSRKQGNSTTGAAARSFEKHEIFKEALTRFEAKLSALTAPPVAKKAPAKKAVAKKAAKKAPAKKSVAKKAASANARSAMSLAKQAKQRSIGTGLRMAASGKNSRVRGHVSAQGRRNQAARSARKR